MTGPEEHPRDGGRILKEMAAQLALTRAEVAVTVLMDGLLIVGAVWFRAFVLWAIRGAPRPDWVITAVDLVLDFGIVGTVVVMTIFDLGKRIRNAIRD